MKDDRILEREQDSVLILKPNKSTSEYILIFEIGHDVLKRKANDMAYYEFCLGNLAYLHTPRFDWLWHRKPGLRVGLASLPPPESEISLLILSSTLH